MSIPFDFNLIIESLPLLGIGALVTIEITAVAVAIGVMIGLFVGIAELSRYWYLRYPAKVYVDFIRGTPLLVQIFIIYFALPIILGVRVEPFVAAVAACSINSGAYVAEIFRAGIQSIDKGQFEAGRSLGMSWGQTMVHIVIPQAFRRIIPVTTSSIVPSPPLQRMSRRTAHSLASHAGGANSRIGHASVWIVHPHCKHIGRDNSSHASAKTIPVSDKNNP